MLTHHPVIRLKHLTQVYYRTTRTKVETVEDEIECLQYFFSNK